MANNKLQENRNPLVEGVTSPGKAFTSGSTRVTPISRRWRVGWPGERNARKGFFLIHLQPVQVQVETGEHTYTLPIRDYQRMIMLPLLLITLVSMFIILCHKPKE